jgi:mannosyltransferase OCH1-like enzyme
VIPRVLHRVWLDDPMPDEYAGYGEKLAGLHPSWEFREWRSTTELPALRNPELFDQATEVCPRDWKRFRSGLLRLELLWLYGGLYVDCDVEPLAPFDRLLELEAFVCWSPNRWKGRRLLTDCVLGATPRHPFIAACLAGVAASIEAFAHRPTAVASGPCNLTRVFESQEWPGVVTLPEQVFGPQSIRDRDKGMPVNLAGALGWHRWANSRDRRHGGVPQ